MGFIPTRAFTRSTLHPLLGSLPYASARDLLEVRAGDPSVYVVVYVFYAAHLRAITITNLNIYKASNML